MQTRVGLGSDFLLNRCLYATADPAMMASSGGAGAAGSGATSAAEPAKAKEIFDLKLKAVDAKAKIKVIKEVRTITGLGLKEVSSVF